MYILYAVLCIFNYILTKAGQNILGVFSPLNTILAVVLIAFSLLSHKKVNMLHSMLRSAKLQYSYPATKLSQFYKFHRVSYIVYSGLSYCVASTLIYFLVRSGSLRTFQSYVTINQKNGGGGDLR